MPNKDPTKLRGILVQLDRGELLGKGGVDWALKDIEAHIAAQVAAALDMVLEKAPKDMSMLDGRTYPTAHHRVVGINAANSDWRGAIKVVRAHLITGQNTDQYKCQSYYDDNNVLQDCTCGVCK
jgi:hypothetical protein